MHVKTRLSQSILSKIVILGRLVLIDHPSGQIIRHTDYLSRINMRLITNNPDELVGIVRSIHDRVC